MTSTATPQITNRPAFDLISSFVATHVIAALEMDGLLTILEEGGLVVDTAASATGVDAALLAASLRYLVTQGLVRVEDERFVLTEEGRAVCRDKGYLVWLCGGYGHVLQQAPAFLTGVAQYGVEVERNGRWVANGSALVGRNDVIPSALRLLQGLSFSHALDLGCGSARLLTLLCSTFGCGGVGVDLSSEACDEARQTVTAAGLADRVQIVEADAADLAAIPHLEKTDLVVAMFLLHEFLSTERTEVVRHMRNFASRLAPGAYFLVAEVPPATSEVPKHEIFTPEFGFIHAVMHQSLLSSDQWQSIFAEAGIVPLQVEPLGLPGGVLLLAQAQR